MYQRINPVRTTEVREELELVPIEKKHAAAITFLVEGIDPIAQAMAIRQMARDARWNIAYVENRIFDVESDKARLMSSWVGSEVQDDRLQKINVFTEKLLNQRNHYVSRLAHAIVVFEDVVGETYHDEAPKPNANQGDLNAQTAAALEANELTKKSQTIIARRQAQGERLSAMELALAKAAANS